MKRFSSLILIASLILLSGCINLSFGGHKPPPPPEVIVQTPPLNAADAATMSEIDAAGRLNFDSARQESLNQLAQRPALSPAVQVHLVNVTYKSLSFDSAKVAVLRSLIANPAFCDAARQAIVTQLGRLSFDSHKQEILRDLNQRVKTS